jgi:hypothetical protein
MRPTGTARRGPQATVAATLLVAASLALAGCGSSSKAKTAASTAPPPAAAASGPPPTRAQFVAQADAICQQTRTSLAGLQTATKALVALGDSPKTFAQAVPLFRRIQAVEQAEIVRLKGLRLPAGDNTEVSAYLHEGVLAVALVGRIADGFAAHDKAGLLATEREGGQMGAVTKGLAQGYGFKVCGRGSGGLGLS